MIFREILFVLLGLIRNAKISVENADFVDDEFSGSAYNNQT
jgi:hypothetical protein